MKLVTHLSQIVPGTVLFDQCPTDNRRFLILDIVGVKIDAGVLAVVVEPNGCIHEWNLWDDSIHEYWIT